MILLAANPYSGTGPNRRRVEAAAAALRALGAPPRVGWGAAERAAALADARAMAGCRAVIAAGGDGTVSQIINELPPGVPLAVLPLGTENLLARALGFAPEPRALARAVVASRTRTVDLGRATAAGRSRLFAVMLGAGFDAAVVHRVAQWRARGPALRRVRRASYLIPIAACMIEYASSRVRLTTEADSAEGAHCVIANVAAYALNLPLTPAATADDGRLDWLMLQRPGRAALLAYCWAVYRGRHLRRADVSAGQATRLSVTSATPTPVQLDGDAWGTTPVEVEIVPRALTVVAPDRDGGPFRGPDVTSAWS
jgi:diacylglycerol kinase (ATP)